MIDPLRDKLLTIPAAAKLLPGRNGRRLAASTAWRWALIGRRGCRLETVVVGGCRYTTESCLREWIRATTAASTPGFSTPPSDPRPEHHDAVEVALDAAGVRIESHPHKQTPSTNK